MSVTKRVHKRGKYSRDFGKVPKKVYFSCIPEEIGWAYCRTELREKHFIDAMKRRGCVKSSIDNCYVTDDKQFKADFYDWFKRETNIDLDYHERNNIKIKGRRVPELYAKKLTHYIMSSIFREYGWVDYVSEDGVNFELAIDSIYEWG